MKRQGQETHVVKEVVFASDEASRDAHKALYHFAEDLYFIVDDDLLGSILRGTEDKSRVHITATWADMIRIATWRREPDRGDIFLLLRNSGVGADELGPFRNSGAGDIFPWLYYARRLDVLRKICRSAKTNVEKNIRNKETRVYCHLMSETTQGIIASSL